MPIVNFVYGSGDRREIEVESGQSLMEAARNGGVDEILAECGGCLACATCHIYVPEEWYNRITEADSMESELLDGLINKRPNSRLSCQIVIGPDLEGLVVMVPDDQI